MQLSKPQIDLRIITSDLAAQLAFWRDTVGLQFSAHAEMEDVLDQYRYQVGQSVLKINTKKSDGGLVRQSGGYRATYCTQFGLERPVTGTDPDGYWIEVSQSFSLAPQK